MNELETFDSLIYSTIQSILMTLFQFFSPLLIALISSLGPCNKSDFFCIENLSFAGKTKSGEHSIVLPDGQTFTGTGALPFAVKIGKYQGMMSSIVTNQVPGNEGLNVELVHFFDDGDGHTFWTSDKAKMTPTSDPSGAVMNVDDTMTVIGGTGDFQCASGTIKNIGTIDFNNLTLQIQLTGSVCAGCD